ncbi:MAG: hypothetical protein BWY87_01628 [Deltaproteobacteria bacterium ADurb.Bin510]|nr:MAG: hypothetical protein BWY87_01628 [Deltaproteobacteria bacterium ADurb.Bin510]
MRTQEGLQGRVLGGLGYQEGPAAQRRARGAVTQTLKALLELVAQIGGDHVEEALAAAQVGHQVAQVDRFTEFDQALLIAAQQAGELLDQAELVAVLGAAASDLDRRAAVGQTLGHEVDRLTAGHLEFEQAQQGVRLHLLGRRDVDQRGGLGLVQVFEHLLVVERAAAQVAGAERLEQLEALAEDQARLG